MPDRTLLALLAVALCVAASAQPAVAAPPPTLTGERLEAQGPAPEPNFYFNCRANPDGTETYFFRASTAVGSLASATGPYPGGYEESGQLTIRRTGTGGSGDVLALEARFTIDSPTGQVSGSKRLTEPVKGAAFDLGCTSTFGYSSLNTVLDVKYSATITSASGAFADRGRARLSISTIPDIPAKYQFQEDFASSLSAPERILFGNRSAGFRFSPMSANAKRASAFVFFSTATVRKVSAFIDGNGASTGSQAVRAVIYRHSSGLPSALVARSFQAVIPAGQSPDWVDFYLAPPVSLSPGVYWLGLHSGATNGVARFAWSAVDNSRRFNVDYYPDGPSNPFGSAALDNQQLSIFASGSY